MEQSGDEWAVVVRNWQPISRAKDEEAYSRAIEAWEAAKKKLEELRSSIPNNLGNIEGNQETIETGALTREELKSGVRP